MRLKIKPPISFKPNEQQLAALRRHSVVPVELYPEDHSYEWSRGQIKDDLVCDPAALYNDPLLAGLEFRIEGGQIELSNMLTLMDELQQTLNRVAGMVIPNTAPAREQLYNERCNVHVPGLGLLIIDEVKVLYDQCTDGLQEYLDEGWRILAVCPQPDKRRPDYVLGRKKP